MLNTTKYYLINLLVSIFQLFLWVLMRIILKIFTDFKVSGIENVRKIKGPIIFAPNHSSQLDPILLGTSLDTFRYIKLNPVYFVTLDYSYYSKIASSMLVKIIYKITPFIITGSVPIVKGVKDYKVSLKRHTNLLNKGKDVCIFPEGQMTKNGELGKPRGGVGYMAESTGIAVIPVSMTGLYRISIKDILFNKPQIRVLFNKPLYFKDSFDKANSQYTSYKDFSEEVLECIKQGIIKINSTK